MKSITPCFIPYIGIFYGIFNKNQQFRQGFNSTYAALTVVLMQYLYCFVTIYYLSEKIAMDLLVLSGVLLFIFAILIFVYSLEL